MHLRFDKYKLQKEMKLNVVIPGFGDPHWNHKLEILEKNRNIVESFNWDVQWHIIQYTVDDPSKTIPPKANMRVVQSKGILASNINRHMSPSQIGESDYVMILLDDVELVKPINWQYVLDLMDVAGADIASPSLPNRSMSPWDFMISRLDDTNLHGQVATRCELFCYLMSYDNYKKYYNFVDPENPWMWGMDFMLLSHMTLKPLIMNKVHMIHHYWRPPNQYTNDHLPYDDSVKYLNKHNVTWDELKALPSIINQVLST
jgi:hypothetical protein